MAKKDGLLMYKGYPLVRNGKTIYYGNSYDPFVVMIQIASTKQSGDLEIADKVLIAAEHRPRCSPQRTHCQKEREKGSLCRNGHSRGLAHKSERRQII